MAFNKPLNNGDDYFKNAGDPLIHKDWNEVVGEVVRLEDDKVNRNGDTIKGQLIISDEIKIDRAAEIKIDGTALIANWLIQNGGDGLNFTPNEGIENNLYISTMATFHVSAEGLPGAGDEDYVSFFGDKMRITTNGSLRIGASPDTTDKLWVGKKEGITDTKLFSVDDQGMVYIKEKLLIGTTNDNGLLSGDLRVNNNLYVNGETNISKRFNINWNHHSDGKPSLFIINDSNHQNTSFLPPPNSTSGGWLFITPQDDDEQVFGLASYTIGLDSKFSGKNTAINGYAEHGSNVTGCNLYAYGSANRSFFYPRHNSYSLVKGLNIEAVGNISGDESNTIETIGINVISSANSGTCKHENTVYGMKIKVEGYESSSEDCLSSAYGIHCIVTGHNAQCAYFEGDVKITEKLILTSPASIEYTNFKKSSNPPTTLSNPTFKSLLSLTPRDTQPTQIGYNFAEIETLGLKELLIYKGDKPTAVNYEKMCVYLLEIVRQHEAILNPGAPELKRFMLAPTKDSALEEIKLYLDINEIPYKPKDSKAKLLKKITL